SKFFGIVGYALGFIMVPIYLFFFLKESVVIQKNWRRFIPLRASKFKDEVVDVVTEVNDSLIAFFRGQVIVSLIDGFLVGLVLKFFGHPYAILIGIALAILGLIPFIGNIICMLPAAVTAYAHFSMQSEQHWLGENPWMYVVVVLAIFVVVQQINSLITAPKIVGDSVGLHPMTVIFSMLFWSLLLGGFLGALLAVPLTASVKVLFKRYIWERQVMVEGQG
ncbi:MAG: AI-2E family transporter, partial [Bacteroidota bacterium]